MKFNKWGRILVCLVLIWALVVNISPIKVQAMALPEAGAAATASKIISLTAPLGTQIFGWVLLGLGLTISTINMINLVNDFQAYSDTMEVSIYYYPDGSWSYGVDMDFVERVRAFLFDTGVLELSIPFPDSDSVVNYDALVSNINAFKSYPYALVVYHDSVQWTVCGSYSPCSFFKTTDGNYYLFRTDDSSRSIVFVKTYNSGETSKLDWNVSTVTSFCRFGAANSDDTDFDIISDYELGTVAPLEVPVPEGYPEWYTNARPATNPDTDEEKIILPIPLNPDSESEGLPESATQPDAWAGSNADALPDMDTDADSGLITYYPDTRPFLVRILDKLSEILNLPQLIAEAMKAVLQELFIPDPEFIPNKVEALKAEYKFLDPILSTGEEVKMFFQNIGSQPPIIWIDLGAGTGWYPMGGKVKFIDLTWYSQYKPIVDPIVGGFIWLWLAWRMFKAVPGLLSGDSGTVGAPTIAPDITFNPARLPAGRSRRKKDGE